MKSFLKHFLMRFGMTGFLFLCFCASNPDKINLPEFIPSDPILSIHLENDVLELTVGEEINLLPFIQLDHANLDVMNVSWFINDTQILAEVAPNTFKALGTGSTTLKAYVENQAQTFTVRVLEPTNPLQNFSFLEPFGILNSTSSHEVLFENTTLSPSSPLSLSEVQALLSCPLILKSSDSTHLEVTPEGLYTPLANGLVLLTLECGAYKIETEVLIEAFDLKPPLKEEADPNPEETLLSVTFNLDSTYLQNTTKILVAHLTFSSGVVKNVSSSFVTPLGQAGQIKWRSSSDNLLIENGLIYFLNYGEARLSLSVYGQTFQTSVIVKAATENPLSSSDRFLTYDDFENYEACSPTPCPGVSLGKNAGYATHLFPEIIMNEPFGSTHVLSLGSGGSITLALNGFYPVDGQGDDFTIFENPLLDADNNPFAERAQVSVSQDGVRFFDFDCNAFDPLQIYEGCAGVNPVYLGFDFTKPESGGDRFDLESLNLEFIRFIRITDLKTCSPSDPTYSEGLDGSAVCDAIGKEGFDLDALVILNGVND